MISTPGNLRSLPAAARPHTTPWFRLALAVVVCAAAYYFIDHGFTVSQYLETLEEQTLELDELVAQGNSGRRAGFALLGLLGLAGCLMPGRRDFRAVSFCSAMLAAYFVWCYTSVLWTDDLALTTRRFGVLTFLILAMLGLCRQLTARDICWLVLGVSSLHLLIGILAELKLGTLRPWMDEYRFAGTIHPNNQGVQLAGMALAAICLAADVRRGRGWLWALALVAGVFLILTKSRTSCAGLILALIVIWLPKSSRFCKACVYVFLPFLASTALLVAFLLNLNAAEKISSIALMGRGEEAGTLTGRIPLWIELSSYVEDQPLCGYGYGSFWNVARMRRISESQGWQIAHSHSAFLETILNLGVIGACFLFAATCAAWLIAMYRYLKTDDPGYRFVCGFTAFAGLYSTTDAVFAQPGYPTLIWLAGLSIVACSRSASRRPASAPSGPTLLSSHWQPRGV